LYISILNRYVGAKAILKIKPKKKAIKEYRKTILCCKLKESVYKAKEFKIDHSEEPTKYSNTINENSNRVVLKKTDQ